MNESERMSPSLEPQADPFHISQSERNTIIHDQLEENFLEETSENPLDDEPGSPSTESSALPNEKEFSSPRKEHFSPQFEVFKKDFDEQSDLEGKLQLAIDFMEASLAQGGTPHFRSFWEARRLCLPVFKENISPLLRSHLWNKYSELSKEARRLKDILDEQSAFAVEQIEIAILALERDITQFEEQVEKSTFPEQNLFPQVLKEHFNTYERLQKELNILNTQAARINALRKELLKTEMRVRHKNKFFQRLSTAGDQVFPKRKELIKQVSQQFGDDIDLFIQKYFGENPNYESLYVLREEIKGLQGLAKFLTLNTHSFTHTRTRLSECWDHIKVEEKERKKERAQQRVLFRQNAEDIDKQIQSLKETIEKKVLSPAEAQKGIESIGNQMRKVDLGRDEVKILREALNDVRKMIQTQIKSEEEARQQLELERNRQKKEKYFALKEKAERMLKEHDTYEADQLSADRDAFLVETQDSSLTKTEKQELDRLIKPLRDIITEKKDKSLLELSEDDRQALQQLQNILKQRKERRQEVKNQLEVLRKGAGSSSLDFEKAMNYTMQINEEKERLEKANQSIKEIESKVSELQAKIRNKS